MPDNKTFSIWPTAFNGLGDIKMVGNVGFIWMLFPFYFNFMEFICRVMKSGDILELNNYRAARIRMHVLPILLAACLGSFHPRLLHY